MGIGYRIKEARERLGLTQTELGSKVGVTGSAITNYEKETSHPKEQIIYKLMEILGVDANYLFQDVVNIPKSGNDVTLAEYEYIKKYRDLDPHGKEMVSFVINKEYDRVFEVKNFLVSNGISLITSIRDNVAIDELDDLKLDDDVSMYLQEILEGSDFSSFTESDAIEFCRDFILSLSYGYFKLPNPFWSDIKQQCIFLAQKMSSDMISQIDVHKNQAFYPFLLNAAHTRTDIPITNKDVQHDDNIMDDENF